MSVQRGNKAILSAVATGNQTRWPESSPKRLETVAACGILPTRAVIGRCRLCRCHALARTCRTSRRATAHNQLSTDSFQETAAALMGQHEKGCLENVLDVVLARQAPATDLEHLRPMPLHKFTECGLVPAARKTLEKARIADGLTGRVRRACDDAPLSVPVLLAITGRVRRACDDAPLSVPVRLCDAPNLLVLSSRIVLEAIRHRLPKTENRPRLRRAPFPAKPCNRCQCRVPLKNHRDADQAGKPH